MGEKGGGFSIYVVLVLLFLLGYIVLLYVLKTLGVIIFVNRISLFKQWVSYLGSSIYFFGANFVLYSISCIMLGRAVHSENLPFHKVRFWDTILNISISLFFGIGIIYTAVGMQRAFQVALGNINESIASALGPWGVLQRLVEGGLILALFTTIVGGALGYTLRLVKFLLFGSALVKIKSLEGMEPYAEILERLDSIRDELSKRPSNYEDCLDGTNRGAR